MSFQIQIEKWGTVSYCRLHQVNPKSIFSMKMTKDTDNNFTTLLQESTGVEHICFFAVMTVSCFGSPQRNKAQFSHRKWSNRPTESRCFISFSKFLLWSHLFPLCNLSESFWAETQFYDNSLVLHNTQHMHWKEEALLLLGNLKIMSEDEWIKAWPPVTLPELLFIASESDVFLTGLASHLSYVLLVCNYPNSAHLGGILLRLTRV